MGGSWQPIAEHKRAQREALIPKDCRLPALPSPNVINVTGVPRSCGLLSAQELDITENYDATALAQAISSGRLKCIDVTRAFCKASPHNAGKREIQRDRNANIRYAQRAAIAQQLTNCLTEIFFDQALARAAYLDHHLSQHGKTLGPLHGVPISLKDSFRIAGMDSSIGIVALALKPSTSTSPLVSMLLSAGAVLYCKTNVPQTLMGLDSDNNVFGRTLNPLNRYVTAGGSSGGEGALIAMRGSVLGIGTDIGGSIRIPAMCNGIYGIKPSAHRVPYAGQESGQLPGASALSVQSCAGPLARSLRDCELLLRTVAAAKPWERDPAIVPGVWDSMDQSLSSVSPASNPLTIGILHTDGLITPLPPIRDLLKEVSSTLSSAGIRIVNIPTPPAFRDIQSLANALFGIEGGNNMFDLLESHGEPLTAWLAPRLKRKAPLSLDQGRVLHAQRELMMREMLSLWRLSDGTEVDALICPVAPHPVPPIDRWNGVSYTSSWVLLDCPAGTIPVREFAERDLHGEVEAMEPLSSWDKVNRELWDGDKIDRRVYIGTPLCVQVVAPRLQEKRLYHAMEIVDRVLNEKKGKLGKAKL